jgi:hypothetical protein
MARWDKFIENASKGYGLGYERGTQYQEGQLKRDIKTSDKEIGGILDGTMEQQFAIPSESINIPEVDFKTVGYDEAGRRHADMNVGDIASTPEEPVKLTGKVTGPQTSEQMAQLKSALKRSYELKGDTDGLMNLDNKITEYRQNKILSNLDDAARLIESDPQAAAAALHNAYGYYPDGKQAMFTMKNGELYGYGFDEETNKFSNKQKIDSKSIAAIAEQMRDPQAFKSRIADENIARASTAYNQWKDKVEMGFKDREVTAKEEGVVIDKDRAEYQNLKDWAAAVADFFKVDIDGLNGKGAKDAAALRGQFNGAIDYFDKAITEQRLPASYSALIGSDEGSLGIGYTQVQGAIGDILFNNLKYTDGGRLLSDADVMNAAMDARMMEMFTQRQLSGRDADGDDNMKAVFDDLMERQGGVKLGERGTLEMVVGGQTVHLTPSKYPALTQAAAQQQGVDPTSLGLPAAPSAPAAPSGVVPTDETINYGPKGYGLQEGAADLYEGAVSGVTEGLLDNRGAQTKGLLDSIAKRIERGQAVPPQQLQELRRTTSAAELRQMGAPTDLIEALFPGHGGAAGVLPGVQ